ncbi:SinR family protein [Burkholderia ubonensis]|uniref:SinR family protein n=1 Tax=Burkholderia ubonensis TaxID=101571 RepID=UPI000AF6006E|nr:SinR family protein [Burkholderia ubonensis]
MSILMIGYDLNKKDGEDYKELHEAIKDIGSWWHCLESTWLVKTDKTVSDVRDTLSVHLHGKDKLLVVKVKVPTSWASHNLKSECVTWLKQHVSESETA